MNTKVLAVTVVVAAVPAVSIIALESGRWARRSGIIALEAGSPGGGDLQRFLETNIRGIEIGEPFPELPVWSLGGDTAAMAADLVQDEGILFFVSSICESCVEAVSLMLEAQTRLGPASYPVVIISSSRPQLLIEALAKRGISVPLWCDQQDLLMREYKVLTTRSWFRLDGNGIVRAFGSASFDSLEYESILNREAAP